MTGMDPVAELVQLCAIASPTGEERALCDHVEAELVRALGRACVVRDGDSVLAVPDVRGDGPRVVLAGHLDTVRTEHDGPARIEGDRVYGAGAADMKSGLAVMLAVARRLARDSARVTPVFVFYEAEEGPFALNRLGDLLVNHRALREADLAVCLEPSSNVMQLGCMGSLHARVTFRGRTAHSARPWQGENAIHKAAGVLARLGARTPRDVVLDEMTYREVMSATTAEGGRGRNVVPDAFALNVNVRFAPGRTPDEAADDLVQLVAGDADVEVIDRSPSSLPFGAHPLVAQLAACGVKGTEPKQAWTDVARFAQLGIAAVNLGPGTQSQAHQKNEWTDRAALLEGVALFERFVFGP